MARLEDLGIYLALCLQRVPAIDKQRCRLGQHHGKPGRAGKSGEPGQALRSGSDELALVRRRMGYVIQGGGLFPHLTARENVSLLARHLGWASKRIDSRIEELKGKIGELKDPPLADGDSLPVRGGPSWFLALRWWPASPSGGAR